ncbi:uncharacterized protein LOC144552857 [Carex rostrata]
MASSRQVYYLDFNYSVDSPSPCLSFPCYLSPLALPTPPLPCPPAMSSPSLSVPDKPTPIGLPEHKDFFHNHMVLVLTLLACIFAISLLSTVALIFFRRRLQRRRALAAALIDPPFFPSDPDTPAPGAGPGPGPGPGEDPIHHVWYIRTVGLDEATIESIAVTKYQAGTGLLGSADCSVCLGDFQDGDLVRLLPKCGHAFHVPCIDTWLRAHVNCPVCRSDVVDPKATAADGDSTIVSSEASAGDMEETRSEAGENGEVSLDVQSRDSEVNEHEHEVFVEIPLSDSSSDSGILTLQADSEDREPNPNPVRHRSASVDSLFLVPNVVITIPESYISGQVLKEQLEQSGKEKERPSNGSKAGSTRFEMVRSFSRPSGSGRAFFFSRSGRSRSTVLPLIVRSNGESLCQCCWVKPGSDQLFIEIVWRESFCVQEKACSSIV